MINKICYFLYIKQYKILFIFFILFSINNSIFGIFKTNNFFTMLYLIIFIINIIIPIIVLLLHHKMLNKYLKTDILEFKNYNIIITCNISTLVFNILYSNKYIDSNFDLDYLTYKKIFNKNNKDFKYNILEYVINNKNTQTLNINEFNRLKNNFSKMKRLKKIKKLKTF